MKKEELIQELVKKTEEKNRVLKNFIISIAVILICFLLDGLYNAARMLASRGDLGEKSIYFETMLNTFLPLLFLLWLLLILVAAVITFKQLIHWLKIRNEIEQIKIWLDNLK